MPVGHFLGANRREGLHPAAKDIYDSSAAELFAAGKFEDDGADASGVTFEGDRASKV